MESKLDQLYQCLQSIQCEITVKIEDVPFEKFIDVSNAFSYDQELLKNNIRKPYRILSVQNITEFISSKENETILWLDQQRQLHYIDQDLQEYLVTC